MSYINKNLMPGERVTYSAKISVWSMLPEIIVGVILSFVVVGLLILLALFVRYISTEMAITNQRVIAKKGFISRDTVEIDLNRIESIRVQQGLLGRMCDFGAIVLAGAGNPQAPFKGISKPMEFRRAFDAARRGGSSQVSQHEEMLVQS
ncbi:PH domain-containing protein [Castellaniella sp. UC4442_H9]